MRSSGARAVPSAQHVRVRDITAPVMLSMQSTTQRSFRVVLPFSESRF